MNEFLQKSATNCSPWNGHQLIIDTQEKEIFMISSTKYYGSAGIGGANAKTLTRGLIFIANASLIEGRSSQA
ncbi:unnamed protein product [Sphagnum balticum]